MLHPIDVESSYVALQFTRSIFFFSEEDSIDQIDLSIFSGNLRRDDHDKARNCWTLSDGNNFRVRSKRFCYDKSKVISSFCFVADTFCCSSSCLNLLD